MTNTFSLENKTNIQNQDGSYDIFPKIKILAMNGDEGSFVLTNIDTGKEIVISGIQAGDIYELEGRNIRCTKIDGTPKNVFKNWNKELFVLHRGINNFETENSYYISVYMQYPIF